MDRFIAVDNEEDNLEIQDIEDIEEIALPKKNTKDSMFVKPKKVEYITKKTKKIPGIKVDKDVISSGPFKMFGAKNKGANFSAESIERFKKANRAQEERRGFSILKDKMAKAAEDRAAKKIAFNEKIRANNANVKKVGNYFKKGTMVKARGGGMARTKPTKLS